MAHLTLGPPDKRVLDPYPGEPGLTRWQRLLVIAAASLAPWGLLAAIMLGTR